MEFLREAFRSLSGVQGKQQESKQISLGDGIPPGVVTGDNLRKLFQQARENRFAIPSFRCYSASDCNTFLQAAQQSESPVGITIASSTASDAADAISLALQVRKMASQFRIPVILHSQHCYDLLPMLEELLSADQEYFAAHGEPLYSSHGLNLSRDPCWEESISICAKYFAQRFVPIKLWLELDLGDSLPFVAFEDQTTTTLATLPWPPHRIGRAHQVLSKIGAMFSIVIRANDRKSCIRPKLHGKHQCYLKATECGSPPIFFVLQDHKASCLSDESIATAIEHGAVKMNVPDDGRDSVSVTPKSNPQCAGIDTKNTTTLQRIGAVFERSKLGSQNAPKT